MNARDGGATNRPSPRVQLRGLLPDDTGEVARVWLDSWRSTGLADGSSLDRLARRLVCQDWTVVVACVGSEIVGFMAYEPEPRWLRQIIVKPAWKRSRIGTALLEAAKDAMPSGFWLRTQIQNSAAKSFYERSGLRLSGEEVHPTTGALVSRYSWIGTATRHAGL